MDEDQILQSIIADPDVVDPTIDVSKLRQTTPTSSRLLGNVSGIEGLRFDPTRTDYVRDLYSVYSGGLPTIDVAPVVDTTTPTVDTTTPTVDIGGGGGGMDQVTGGGGITPTETITQPSFDDQFQSIEDIGAPIDVGFGEGQVDPGLAAGLEGPIIDTSPVTPTITSPSGDVFAVDDPLAEEKIDFTPETQGLVDQAFSKVGSTASDIMNDLSQIPGAIADFANQTVDIAGQKINVGKTLLNAGINKLAGAPISLVFDLLPQESLENKTSKSIVDELKGQSNKSWNKFNMTVGNLNVDPFGRSPVSGFGNYEQTLKEDVLGINQTGFQTAEMREAKKEFAEAYFDAKAERAGGVVTEPGTVVGPGEMPVTQEEIDAFNAPPPGINIVDEVALTGGDGQDTGPPEGPGATADEGFGQIDQGEVSSDAGFVDTDLADDFEVSGDIANVGTAMDLIGPAPTPQDIPDRGRGDTSGSGQISDAQAAANRDAARGQTGGGSSGGGGKIVCTMMNESYGFGSFRNKIWLKHSKNLAPEYQKGYHKIFLPLVRLSKNNKVLKKTLEHIAVHRTIDIRQEARGKVHLLGRVYRKILEPICYIVGKYAKR